MKKFLPVLSLVSLAFLSQTNAQIFLDVNGDVAGFGNYNTAGPTWNTTNTNWTTNPAGTATTTTWSNTGITTFDNTGGTGEANVTVDGNFSVNGLGLNGTRSVTLQNTSTGPNVITLSGGTVEVATGRTLQLGARVEVQGNFTKQGAGTLRFGSNTGVGLYSGTITIDAGNVTVAQANRTGNNSNFVVNAGSLQVLNGSVDTNIGSLSGAGGSVELSGATPNNRVVNINQTSNGTFSGGFAANSGTGTFGVVKNGGGTLILDGSSTFDGSMTINTGRVVAASNNALSNGSTGTTVGANGILQINNGVTLHSTASVTLAAASSILEVGSTGAIGTSAIGGGLTASSGATFLFDLNGTTPIDLLNIAGTASLNGTVDLQFNNLGGSSFAQNTWYTILSAGTLSGTPTITASVIPTGFSGFDSQIVGNNLQVQFAAIPEPSTWALVGFGLFALILVRRRRLATVNK